MGNSVKIKVMSGNTIVVKNSPQEVIEKIVTYRKRIGIGSQEV